MFANYDVSLVLASFVVAVLASYSALYFGAKLIEAGESRRWHWLLFGAFTMGSGIWTMHFVGMRASIDMGDATYGAGLTFVSWIAAIGASALALHLISRPTLKVITYIGASLAMGLGIVVMHYVGMFAMNMSMAASYDPIIFAISVAIAVGASGAALVICRKIGTLEGSAFFLQLGAALTMAVAICGMHYTGMAAMMYPEAAVPAPGNLLGGELLGLPLAMLASTLLLVAVVVTGVDVHTQKMARKFEQEGKQWVASAAFSDSVTGLPNRAALEQRILDHLAADTQKAAPFGLVHLEIGNYRQLNDRLDSVQLDKLVKGAAEKLKETANDDVFIAKYSASAFVLMIRQPKHQSHDFLYKQLQNLQRWSPDPEVRIQWRAGQSLYPETGHSSRRLIRAAMVARDFADLGTFTNLADDPRMVGNG